MDQIAVTGLARRSVRTVRRTLAVGCLLVSTLVGCGDDAPEVANSATTAALDESWFAFRSVLAISQPPCAAYTTPSIDLSECYELGERLLGPSGIVEAKASGFDLPANCDQSQVGEICIDTEPPGGTAPPAQTVWSVPLVLSADALGTVNAAARQCFERALDCPSGQIAIVIDGAVVSAPQIQQPGFEADQFQISGDFTEAEARELATRFDRLP